MLGLLRGPILKEIGERAMNNEYARKLSAFVAGLFLALWPGFFLSILGYQAVFWFCFQTWPAMPLSELAPFAATVWAYGLPAGTFRALAFWLLNLDALSVLGALALGSSLILLLVIMSHISAMRELKEELRREAYGNLRSSRFT